MSSKLSPRPNILVLAQVVVHLETGGGKSLLYQMASMLDRDRRITVVFMPLIKLRDQQASRARELGLKVVVLKSGKRLLPKKPALVTEVPNIRSSAAAATRVAVPGAGGGGGATVTASAPRRSRGIAEQALDDVIAGRCDCNLIFLTPEMLASPPEHPRPHADGATTHIYARDTQQRVKSSTYAFSPFMFSLKVMFETRPTASTGTMWAVYSFR